MYTHRYRTRRPGRTRRGRRGPGQRRVTSNVRDDAISCGTSNRQGRRRYRVSNSRTNSRNRAPPKDQFDLTTPVSFLFHEGQNVKGDRQLRLLLRALVLRKHMYLSVHVKQSSVGLLDPRALLTI